MAHIMNTTYQKAQTTRRDSKWSPAMYTDMWAAVWIRGSACLTKLKNGKKFYKQVNPPLEGEKIPPWTQTDQSLVES